MTPAFPTTEYYDEKPIGCIGGMTLRDYFAAKAMQALIASITDIDDTGIIQHRPTDVAEIALVYADAMLAERAK